MNLEIKKCITCGKDILGKSKPAKYCNSKCEYKGRNSKSQKIDIGIGKESSKGVFSELNVCADLLKKGYDVFKNISPFGSVDLIIYNNSTNQILKIEVTSGFIQHNGARAYTKHKNTNNSWDIIAVLYPDSIIYYNNKYEIINF